MEGAHICIGQSLARRVLVAGARAFCCRRVGDGRLHHYQSRRNQLDVQNESHFRGLVVEGRMVQRDRLVRRGWRWRRRRELGRDHLDCQISAREDVAGVVLVSRVVAHSRSVAGRDWPMRYDQSRWGELDATPELCPGELARGVLGAGDRAIRRSGFVRHRVARYDQPGWDQLDFAP